MKTLIFNFGFIFDGVRYGWLEKKLYKLPFTKNKRSYSLKIIAPCLVSTTICYNVQKNKVTINRLKDLTTSVNWEVKIITHSDCPF